MRAVFLLLALAAGAAGQVHLGWEATLSDLTITGDGSAAYFTSTLPLKSEAAQPGPVPGRIFRVSPSGFELYLQRPRIDPPPPDPYQKAFTNYFDLFRPQVSRDGSIVAVAGQRICRGSDSCISYPTLQTTISGLPGGSIDVTGAGRLSGNGRYLFVYATGAAVGECGYVVDLEAPQAPPPQSCPAPTSFFSIGAGRSVADDGTAVSALGDLHLIRGLAVTQVYVPSGSSGEAVIDSAASRVVYSFLNWSTNQRSIRLYRIAEQRDTELAGFPDADSHTPYITADGRLAMFVSDAPGLPQIYTIAIDGGEAHQVTHDTTGVLSAAMSDDGRLAWYFSGSGRLRVVDLSTGATQERLGRTPQIGRDNGPVGRLTAGGLFFLQGMGFSDAWYTAAAYPLPRSLDGASVTVNGVAAPLVLVSPTQIFFQVPYLTPPDTTVQVNTESSSPFVPLLSFASTTYSGLGAFIENQKSASAYGAWDAAVVHQDWSALITAANPARPNEIVHLFGTGFGPVDFQPADGMPGPADPPSHTVTLVSCWAWGADNRTQLAIPVLYSGLAVGLVGIYQLDVRLPASNLRPSVQLSCTGEGDNSTFFGSFAVSP